MAGFKTPQAPRRSAVLRSTTGCMVRSRPDRQYRPLSDAGRPGAAATALLFKDRGGPDFTEHTPAKLGHGRDETRRIWVTSEVNAYVKFPHVGQAAAIERDIVHRKTGKRTKELVYTITSRTKGEADAKRLLEVNRGHWSIENSCHYVLDWNYDEDRGRIRTGYGPENVTRLRRFTISVIKSMCKARPVPSVAQKMRELASNSRLVFDFLRMTANSCASARR